MCNAIAPEKDVDGFHIVNIGKLCLDQRSMVPATPAAVWEIIKRAGKPPEPSLLMSIFFIPPFLIAVFSAVLCAMVLVVCFYLFLLGIKDLFEACLEQTVIFVLTVTLW